MCIWVFVTKKVWDNMTKILICGDRNWADFKKVEDKLNQFNPLEDIIITGGCRGADKIAEYLGKKKGFKVEVFPADWNKYGLGAGPVRNKQMLDQNPSIVIAFHSDIDNSKGTKNCITQAAKKEIPVEVIA